MPKDIPEKYIHLQRSWAWYERYWKTLHYALGLLATLLAFAAANKGIPGLLGEQGDKHASTLAVFSGLAAAALTFFSPASRRKAYTEARNLLRITRLRYEVDEPVSLNDAVKEAQDIIAKR